VAAARSARRVYEARQATVAARSTFRAVDACELRGRVDHHSVRVERRIPTKQMPLLDATRAVRRLRAGERAVAPQAMVAAAHFARARNAFRHGRALSLGGNDGSRWVPAHEPALAHLALAERGLCARGAIVARLARVAARRLIRRRDARRRRNAVAKD